MKITLNELQQSFGSLGKLGSQEKLSIKQKYWVSRLIKKCETELKHVEDARLALVEKYKKEHGEKWADDKAQIQLFLDEFNTLLQEETEDFGINPFKLSELPEDNTLTAIDLARLDWFIVDSE